MTYKEFMMGIDKEFKDNLNDTTKEWRESLSNETYASKPGKQHLHSGEDVEELLFKYGRQIRSERS